jgi:hypothetical protein
VEPCRAHEPCGAEAAQGQSRGGHEPCGAEPRGAEAGRRARAPGSPGDGPNGVSP